MLHVVQIAGVLFASVALSVMLFGKNWSRGLGDRSRLTLQFFGVCLGLLFSAVVAAKGEFASYKELWIGTMAIGPFALVSFWSVVCRDAIGLRIAAFTALLVTLAMLLRQPVSNETLILSLNVDDRLRLCLGICGGIIVGVYCRLLGWRMEEASTETRQNITATTRDLWILIVGITLSVPLIFLVQWAAQSYFSNLFDSSFTLIRMSCFYAACMLAFMSITVCRFSNQWLVAACIIISALTVQFTLGENLYERLGFYVQDPQFGWDQFSCVFILFWWSLCVLLRQVDVVFQKTGDLLLFQFQLKHFVATTALVCFLVASINSQYQAEFPKHFRREMLSAGCNFQSVRNRIISLSISGGSVPDILRRSKSKLKHVTSATISGTIEQESIDILRDCPKLTSLTLRGCTPSVKSQVNFLDLTSLERLFVEYSTLTKEQLSELPDRIRALRVDDPTLSKGVTFKTLRQLELDVNRPFDLDDLLHLRAPELRSIEYPFRTQNQFTEVPLNLPKLENLDLTCTELTPTIAKELNQLELLELRLHQFESGIDHIRNLRAESIHVAGSFDQPSFETLLQEPKVSDIRGVTEANLNQQASQIVDAHIERGLTIQVSSPRLRGVQNSKSNIRHSISISEDRIVI